MKKFNSVDENFIKKYFNGLKIDNSHFYLYKDIPEKKRRNADETLFKHLHKDEVIYLFYDDTLFGKGDDGAIITNKRIIYKPFLKETFSIDYNSEFTVGCYKRVKTLVALDNFDHIKNGVLGTLEIPLGFLSNHVVKNLGKSNKLLITASANAAGVIIDNVGRELIQFLKTEDKGANSKEETINVFEEDFNKKSFEVDRVVVVNINGELFDMSFTSQCYPIASYLKSLKKK